ncbi:ABC transporter substrate-binding protein, partial [Solidesulfovibrio sp.]
QNSASGALMLIQAKRAGVKAAIIGQDAVYHPQLMEIAKDAAEGMYLTFGFIDENTPSYKKFLAAYEKYGKPGAYSAYAYDAAYSLLSAIKAAGSTDPAKVKAELLKMDMDGASKKIKFQPNGESGSNYIIRVVKDGKFANFWDPQTGKTY